MTKRFKMHLSVIIYAVSVFIFSFGCGDGNKGEGPHNDGGPQNGSCAPGQCCGPDCGPGSGPGQLAIKATADLTGAFGLLVLDNENQANLNLIDKHNETVDRLGLSAPKFSKDLQEGANLNRNIDDPAIEIYSLEGQPFVFPKPGFSENGLALSEENSQAAMQKIDNATGEIKDALTQDKTDNAFDPNRKLPKLKTIAVSPTKDVYLHFENSFIYRDAASTEDPWNPSNGFQCQIFKVKGGTLDDLLTQAPEHNNIECIDNAHFINGWQSFSNGVFQFDNVGNLYYPGTLPNGGKMVVYRRQRDGSKIQEVINANICVQNFLVTNSGGIFYTGNTCQQEGGGGGGNGGGFFRYVAPGANGSIVEIARDWWNFIYDTAVTANQTDTAVFFGPDPRNANTASWDSACIFKFDPTQSDPSTRISEVITCGNNIWEWMELRRAVDVETYGPGYGNHSGGSQNFTPSLAWKKEFRRRCETKDEVFAGGGSQISAIQQDSTGQIYVIGNIRKKAEGVVQCSVAFRGPHCTISNQPILTDANGNAYTQSSCLAANGTWVNKGNCSNQSTDAASCMEHTRSWTPGYCSNPDYGTKAACEAATGCSHRWRTDQASCVNDGFVWHDGVNGNGLVWRTGRCSSDEDKYETQAACEAAGKIWTVETWSGSCTSTDSSDNAALYNNNKYSCIPEWTTEQVWYNNITGSICTTAETASRDTFWDWNHKDNHFAQTASSTHKQYAELTGKFIVDQVSCQIASDSGNSNGNWTTEYSALASIDANGKTLKLLSLDTEKAINLWLVNDKPYYSSFDTSLGQYTLNGLTTGAICNDTSKTSESSCSASNESWEDRKCLVTNLSTKESCEDAGYVWQTVYPYTIITNFETYNLAESGAENNMFADGLDFKDNQYKFGTIDIVQKILSLKKGLTGTLKTIVILPK